MKRNRIRTVVAAASIAATAALAGCGGGGDGYGTDDATSAESGAETSQDATVENDTTLSVADTELGEAIVDPSGKTLYLYTEDIDGIPSCNEDCAANWPPLLVEGPVTASGDLDESMIGTAEREDGSSQVTYNEHPLYTFAQDAAAGDVSGEGIGDSWYVIGPNGEAASGMPTEAS